MRFVDHVQIHVKAGDGGDGAVAFRREKFIARGGPSGGDGGNGGSVIFIADPQLTTLLDYRYQQHHHAKNGENGRGSDCNGAASPDLVLQVPVGTLIYDSITNELLCDLSQPGQPFVAAKGGRGGLGNMNFATSRRQTPRFAQEGTPGEERHLRLELKLLADLGLLGFPNAGKSTLISKISRARPKVADYPFTTLVPNLGMVQYKDRLSFVVADIPGLIEGASEGAGLGHQFLRHVERCRVLIHLVDLGHEEEERDPVRDFDTLNRELEKYSSTLAQKSQLVAASKMDLPMARERLPAFEREMKARGLAVFPISAATGEGVPALLDAAAEVLFARGAEKYPSPLEAARNVRTAEAAPKTPLKSASKPKRAPSKPKARAVKAGTTQKAKSKPKTALKPKAKTKAKATTQLKVKAPKKVKAKAKPGSTKRVAQPKAKSKAKAQARKRA